MGIALPVPLLALGALATIDQTGPVTRDAGGRVGILLPLQLCLRLAGLGDLLQVLPQATVRGLDVSAYAKENAYAGTGSLIDLGSAESLPYADRSFDLVISINSIHNLPPGLCAQALAEMERVSRAHKFVTIDAWRTEEERTRLLDWILTAETYMHCDDWVKLFAEVGYSGDYWWFIP